MNEDLEMLWGTYDFALSKVTLLEDEYDFLLQDLRRFCSQHDAGESDRVGRRKLLSQFSQIGQDLENYYNKQLASIKELKDYYGEHPYEVTEDREVSVEAFAELAEVTVLLKDAMLNSTVDAKRILTSA